MTKYEMQVWAKVETDSSLASTVLLSMNWTGFWTESLSKICQQMSYVLKEMIHVLAVRFSQVMNALEVEWVAL